ncbi:hypothetical protein, partial [Rhodococcus sp. SMB37]|uniref:hypothetical protein n=1 Tax=Rhodococcus sp. SMB37 TaxID=2512213 RepID=UPI001A7EAB72
TGGQPSSRGRPGLERMKLQAAAPEVNNYGTLFINPTIMFCAPYYSGTVGAWYFGETPPPIWAR